MNDRVIIAGAGPVGMFTAMNLTSHGIPVTILEQEETVCLHMRAGGFHPPSVDMMEESGLAGRMKEVGILFQKFHFTDRLTGMDVILDTGVLENDTRNPWDLLCCQQVLTRSAYELLQENGADVEFRFQHSVRNVVQSGDKVIVTCETPDGPVDFSAPWVIGCDGGGSQVRKSLGVKFEGFTWPERFLMVHTRKYDFEPKFGIVNFISDAEAWQMIIKIPYDRGPDKFVWRMVCRVPDDMSDEEALSETYMQQRMQDLESRSDPYEIEGGRVYRVHQRVAETFRAGRVILIGDAAHINNPVGGQGLNCGIHDVANFTGKFVDIWNGRSDDSLLDLYDRQRRLTNLKFIQPISIENKKRMDETDIEKRKAASAYMESLVDDDEARRQFFLRFAMFDSLEYEKTIT